MTWLLMQVSWGDAWKWQRSDVAQVINATVATLVTTPTVPPQHFPLALFNLSEPTTLNSKRKACKHTVKD